MDFLDGMLGGGLNSSSAAAAGNGNHSNGGINNNCSSNNNGGGRGKMCRSASEMDMEQTSRDQDWRGSAGSASSLKMARTDSYPNLMRTNSVISEANTAANGANSSDLLEESRLLRSDSSAASVYPRGCLPVYQQQQQQHQTGSYHQYAANNNRPSGMPLLMGASSAGGAGMGMGMGVGMHSILSCARSPFTAAQWHELEHQALIFKYILAGVQVPSEILIPIRSKVAAATSPMNLFSTLPVSAGSSLRPNLGWSAYHMGFANNADPEPGRCRRTDGKKWRCSRDAVPDQKYCERHMNRGRHRSRKPVEGQTNSAANATSAATATSSATLAVPTAATSSSNNSLAMSQASSSASNLGAAASNPAGLAAVAAAAARTSGLSMVTTHNNNSTAPQSQATNNNNVLGACALGPQQNPQIGGTTAAALSKFASFPSSMASSAAAAPQFQNLDSYVSGLKAGAGAGAGTGAADMETSHIFESSTGLSMMNSSNTAAAAAAWRSRLTAAAAASATYNNSHDTSFLQHQHHQRGDDATDAPGIRHFFDDWPSRSSRDRAVQWPGVAGTQLSISMGSAGGSPPEKLTLSPLKLSMSGKDDPLEMELGLANDTAEEQRQRVAANWIPITWESPVGGPLAEVLNNTAATGKSREVKSSLNLMTDGWDCSGSPRGDGSRMASPTGVLQKTFGSLSDSSTGSSPRSVVVKTEAADAAAAAAGPLCENIRTASFKLAGATATATISTS